MTGKSYAERLRQWQNNRFTPPPRPDPTPTRPTLVESVLMRDGIKLYTEIFLPVTRQDKGFPVILLRSPYPYACPSRNDKRPISRYLEAGYAVVFQLTRGQGKSEGTFHFFRDEPLDGYDCIEWIAAQHWCNGNVGMEGASYVGNTQLLAARTKPPALKCIAPAAFLGNCIRSFPFSCGVPNKGPYMQWNRVVDIENWDELEVSYGDMNILDHPTWGPAFRKRPLTDAADEVLKGDKLTSWRETISNPIDNEFWQGVHFTDDDLAELDLPIFFTDAWFDMTIGPIDYFTRLEKLQPERSDRYLLVGPWNHAQTYYTCKPGDNDGDRVVPDDGGIDMVAQRLAFFDRYLKGDNTIVLPERIKVYITGANQWRHFSTFPAPDTQHRKLYLHSEGDAHSFPGNGLLNWEAPGEEPTDSYIYDPALPTASRVETSADRRHTEIRSDVLTYTSEPLSEPLTILGDITLILHAATDGPDTDWFAMLTEIWPDGRSISFHYAPPAFRARYRNGFDKECFLIPNKPEEFCLPIGPAGHRIAAGNRLRLSLFSAAFPEYQPNSNTGGVEATTTTVRIAKQTIYHDTSRPSHLILPLLLDINNGT